MRKLAPMVLSLLPLLALVGALVVRFAQGSSILTPNSALDYQLPRLGGSSNAWQSLEDYLVSELESQEADENLEKALDWLDELKESSNEKENSDEKEIIHVIELLQDYKNRTERHICTGQTQTIREFLFQILSNSKGADKWSRLPALIQHLSDELTRECQREYVANYMDQLRLMGEQKTSAVAAERIRPFFMEIVHSWISDPALIANSFGAEQRDYSEWAESPKIREAIYQSFVLSVPTLKSEEDAAIAYEAIESLAKQEQEEEEEHLLQQQSGIEEISSNITVIIDGQQAKELFSRLIVDSCEVYASYFGPNVFDLAQRDIFYTANEGIFYERELSDFYLAWAQYRACKSLLENKLARDQLLDRISSVAEQKRQAQASAGISDIDAGDI